MSTQGFTELNEGELNLHNFINIEEDEDNEEEREMEVRNNLENVVGPNDISSDEESSLSNEDSDRCRFGSRNNIGSGHLSSDDDRHGGGEIMYNYNNKGNHRPNRPTASSFTGMPTQGFTVELNEDELNLHSFINIEEDEDNEEEREMEVRNNLENVVGPNDISSDEESSLSNEESDRCRIGSRNNIGSGQLSSDDDRHGGEIMYQYNNKGNHRPNRPTASSFTGTSTQEFTELSNNDDLRLHHVSTITEEDEDISEMEMEVRNNLQEVVGPDDLSSDEESSSSDGEDNDRPGSEIIHHYNNGCDQLQNDPISSMAVSRHPFDDGDNYEDFSHQQSLPESPTNLPINLPLSQSSSIDEPVPEYNLSSILNGSSIKKTYDGFSANQLQHEFLNCGSEKERFQILYETRGREIDDLRTQLELVKKSSKKGCDKLSNALQLTKMKLEGVTISEKQLRALLVELEGEMANLKRDQMDKTETITKLEFQNSTLKSELASTNATIANLEQQAVDLKSVKSLTRNQQINDDFIQKLRNIHKGESDNMTVVYKAALAKTANLQQELEMVNSELQMAKERHATVVQNKDLTIGSLKMSLKTMKPNYQNEENLRIKNTELAGQLDSLKKKYDLTKKNLDCCDLINKMRIFKDSANAEDSIDTLGLIKAIDFGNLSAVDAKDPTDDVITPKDATNNLERIALGLQNSVYCNKKLRQANLHLQQLLNEKKTENVNLQGIIKELRELPLEQRKEERQLAPSETIISLQRQNAMLNELLQESKQKVVKQCDKSTNTQKLEEHINDISLDTEEHCENVSINIIDKYQASLENEKVKRDELEAYYKNQIKELMDKIGKMVSSTVSVASVNDESEAAIAALRMKMQQCAQQIEAMRVEKQQLVDHYEDDIRQITDTLMDKEGEVEESKKNLKSQVTTCELMNAVISDLNMNCAKLSKQNDNLKRQINAGKEFIKGKLKSYREKYQSQQASFEKYRIKADDRIDYYLKEAQRVAREANENNLKRVEDIRSWLNFSRDNIIKKIDSICTNLNKAPISVAVVKFHLHDLYFLKELVSKLILKQSESYFN